MTDFGDVFQIVRGGLGGLTKNLVPVFESFVLPEMAIFLCLLMFGTFLYVLVWMLVKVKFVRYRLDKSTKFIKKHNKSYPEFKKVFREISDGINGFKPLRHSWREFKETLVIEEDSDDVPIGNSIRPQQYLNVHAVEASGKSFRLLQSLPNYFVGFGLLFTFIGLVSAIYFASLGVASDNVDQAQESLGELLNAATFKFLTSITGLGASIVLSITYRIQIQSLQHSFDKMCEALEWGMVFATPETIATKQLSELKAQTAQLKSFNTDFAIEVGKELEKRFSHTLQTNLADALKPLSEALDGMAGNFGKMNQEAISDMTKSFGEDLKGAAGKEMDALVNALDSIQGALGNVVRKIDQTSSEFGSRMADSAGKVEELLGAAGQSIKEQTSSAATAFADKMEASSSELAETLTPLSNQISRFESTINSMETKMADQREAFADVSESVRGITGDVATTIRDLRSATQPLANVADKIAGAAEDIGGAGKAITQSHEQLRLLATSIGETSELMQKAWLDYQSRFEDVDKSLAGSIDQLITGADAYRKHVESFVRELDGMAGNFGRMNQEAISDMTKSFGEDLKGVAGKEMDTLVNALDNIQGALGNVVRQIDQTSSEFGSRMADSAGRMEELLGAAGQSIKEQTSSAATAFADKMEASSGELAKTLTPLSNQISRFESTINSMEIKMADQREAFADVSESVRGITGDVATTIRDLRSATQPLANVADKIAGAAHDVGGAGEAITQSHEQLQLLATSIGETSERMQEAWIDYQSRFENVDKSFAGSIEQLITGADAYRKHVESFVGGLDKSLGDATSSLGGGIERLDDSIQDLDDSIQKLIKSGAPRPAE